MGGGPPCVTRAVRPCSADPLCPASGAFTLLLPTDRCAPPVSDSCRPARVPVARPVGVGGSSSASSLAPFSTPALGESFLQQGC